MPTSLIQKAEGVAPNTTSIVLAFANPVVVGNIVTIEASRYTGTTTDPFVVGDLAKTAGTATIGALVLDTSTIQDVDDVTDITNSGIWHVPVTGSGSLTFTLTGNAADFFWMNLSEWRGLDNVCVARASAIGTGTAADSGNVTIMQPGLILALVSTNAIVAVTLTADAAFTLLNEEENGAANVTGSSAYRIAQGPLTDSASFTLGQSEGWACCAAAYRETAEPVKGLFIPMVAA